jgi:hypothetical protein
MPGYLQVSQDVAEHVLHESEVCLSLLLPPPMKNKEKSFSMSPFPQLMQDTPFSPPMETSASNRFPHFLHKNS